MSIISSIKRVKKSPSKVFMLLTNKGLLNWLPAKPYLKLMFRVRTGKELNLKKPVTFNEKIQWLKLYDKNPTYANFVDKYAVRGYITKKIGKEYLIPLIGVFNKVDEINWDALPNQFVLKCTHGSGSNILCSNKEELDIELAKKKLSKWMKKNWYWYGRALPYKYIQPKIICETYLQDDILDYKIWCFNGQPKLIQVNNNKNYTLDTIDFYDTNWHKTNLETTWRNSDRKQSRPSNLEEMLNIAKILSENDIFVRVDLYLIDGQVYFGEKTYYPASGLKPYYKEESNIELGNLLHLPN